MHLQLSKPGQRAIMMFALAWSAVLGGLLTASPAAAQASRTWVSSTGNDASACTRAAPCQTFAVAIGKTAASGEIDCLDPGEFGPLTITKSIILSCNGIGNAGITYLNGTVITISAGASDIIVIDGLDISGKGNGYSAIRFQTGGALIVRNTTIRNFGGFAIFFQPSNTATLNIDNSTLINSSQGVNISPSGSASVRANISRSLISNNTNGVIASGGSTTGSIFVSIRATAITNNTFRGVNANAGTALYTTIALDEVTVSGTTDGAGVIADAARSGFLVNNSTITNNQDGGLSKTSGGVIYSYGNNRVNGNNAKDGSFTATLQQR